ncbi:unnamed protein product [Arabidopsis arenosa]|uniref:Uncharacterized protein n=1 Tax=Arabidopsis arenosa TaxID=38785 RepID=A0A8S1ZLU2_ARAAE|nr:unnamed protein product [Arabidopsis arenosa]
MVDNSNNKKRKEFISEADIATLLQRYDTITILKLLQEMAYYADTKMDWNELVKKTSTGITNAREYQLLWRHLAYRDSLVPVDNNARVLDDDSDMECELEASPAVGVDVVTEAVAHVKVMAASYVPSESDIPEDSMVEAPLTINIPYGLHRGAQEPSDSYWSSRGMNITFPVFLPKAAEGHNGNGLASSLAPRKRRKKWSAEEDEELIAAVKQHGEGSWALISKEAFEGERTTSQLSQRWGAIRRRTDTSNTSTQTGLQRTEAQMANRAVSLAVGNRLPSKKLAVGITPMLSSGTIKGAQANGANSGSTLQRQQLSQPQIQALPRATTSASGAKSRVPAKKTTGNSTTKAELMVTANSVAAAASSLPRPSGIISAPKAAPVKTAASAASLPRPSGIISAPTAEPVKTASVASLPRPSSVLSAPKADPVKSVPAAATNTKAVGPLNLRHAVNGSPNHTISSSPFNKPSLMAPLSKGSTIPNNSVPPSFASSRLVPTQRVPAATVMPQKPSVVAAATVITPQKPSIGAAVTASSKPVGVQKEQTQGNRASPLVTTILPPNKTIPANSVVSTAKVVGAKVETPPSLIPKKNQVVGSCTDNKSSLDKPPVKESSTTVSPLAVAATESKPKDEKTMTGTGQKEL